MISMQAENIKKALFLNKNPEELLNRFNQDSLISEIMIATIVVGGLLLAFILLFGYTANTSLRAERSNPEDELFIE